MGQFRINLGAVYGKLKLIEEARREYEGGAKLSRDSLPYIDKAAEIWLTYLRNERETVAELLPQIIEHLQESGVRPFDIAFFSFFIGQNDQGFDWLEKSFARKEYSLRLIKIDPDFAQIKSDPRYLNLLERMGLS